MRLGCVRQEGIEQREDSPDVDAVGLVDEVQEDAACQVGREGRQAGDGRPERLPVAEQVARGDGGVPRVGVVVHQHVEALHVLRDVRSISASPLAGA